MKSCGCGSNVFLNLETRNNSNIFTITLELCIAHFLTLGIDTVIKHVTDIEISCKKSEFVRLRNPTKKGFYMLALLLMVAFLMMLMIMV